MKVSRSFLITLGFAFWSVPAFATTPPKTTICTDALKPKSYLYSSITLSPDSIKVSFALAANTFAELHRLRDDSPKALEVLLRMNQARRDPDSGISSRSNLLQKFKVAPELQQKLIESRLVTPDGGLIKEVNQVIDAGVAFTLDGRLGERLIYLNSVGEFAIDAPTRFGFEPYEYADLLRTQAGLDTNPIPKPYFARKPLPEQKVPESPKPKAAKVEIPKVEIEITEPRAVLAIERASSRRGKKIKRVMSEMEKARAREQREAQSLKEKKEREAKVAEEKRLSLEKKSKEKAEKEAAQEQARKQKESEKLAVKESQWYDLLAVKQEVEKKRREAEEALWAHLQQTIYLYFPQVAFPGGKPVAVQTLIPNAMRFDTAANTFAELHRLKKESPLALSLLFKLTEGRKDFEDAEGGSELKETPEYSRAWTRLLDSKLITPEGELSPETEVVVQAARTQVIYYDPSRGEVSSTGFQYELRPTQVLQDRLPYSLRGSASLFELLEQGIKAPTEFDFPVFQYSSVRQPN
jgi:hypothetical protein